MFRKILFFILSGLLTQPLLAQNLDRAKLDQYFDALDKAGKFMGSVALSQNGEIIYTRSVGYADVEKGIKADDKTRYRIGSITKTFTSVLVMKAIEENKLKLEQKLADFFPNVKNADKITLYHMLTHQSGIYNVTNRPDYLSWHTQAKSEKEMVDLIIQGGSVFEPGTNTEYSNSNYILLTYILERVYQKTYAQLLQESVTSPLALTHTAVGGKIQPQQNEAKSYQFRDTWKEEPETDMSVPAGAGNLISTPVDILKFSNGLFGGKLLKPETVAKMTQVQKRVGAGLFAIPFHHFQGFGHTGGIDGFSSMFGHFPETKVAFAITSNGTTMAVNDIAIVLLSAVHQMPYEIPSYQKFEISEEELAQYVGVYASPQIPLKITITQTGKTLSAQATGQQAFPLEPREKNVFVFELAGVVMTFDPEQKTMLLKQGGGQFNFRKEQ